MKNKLHIFGCSHSAGTYGFDSDALIPFWGDYLAEKLNLEIYPRLGHPGKNSEYILLDIFDRIMDNKISKNDYVILNTSHPMRFGTPRLQRYVKHPMDVDFDAKHILGIDVKQSLKLDELKPDLIFDLWYKQTFGAWKLLSSVCDNVYQWLLDDKNELDSTYKDIQIKWREDIDSSSARDYQMTFYPNLEANFGINPWKNLMKHPTGYSHWWEWIKKHKRAQYNWHLHPDLHPDFAEFFYQEIKEYEIHN